MRFRCRTFLSIGLARDDQRRSQSPLACDPADGRSSRSCSLVVHPRYHLTTWTAFVTRCFVSIRCNFRKGRPLIIHPTVWHLSNRGAQRLLSTYTELQHWQARRAFHSQRCENLAILWRAIRKMGTQHLSASVRTISWASLSARLCNNNDGNICQTRHVCPASGRGIRQGDPIARDIRSFLTWVAPRYSGADERSTLRERCILFDASLGLLLT